LDEIPIGTLFGTLIFLILISAFFSASETAMMAVNRYRLKHLAEGGHRGARLARELLQHPDRLLGTILLGNNAANLGASACATIIALELYGEAATAIATGILLLVVLIFAEVAPKSFAAVYPERVAFPSAYVLYGLYKVLYPLVWLVNRAGGRFLRLFGVRLTKRADSLSPEELRVAVLESAGHIPETHQSMLLRVLELESITVDDIMLPRAEIEAINIDEEWDTIVEQLATSHHSRLPVYRQSMDNVVGVLHLRNVLHLTHAGEFNKTTLDTIMREPYFVPVGTPITQQLLNFQDARRRFGLVVDEYGDLRGLVTVEEILEEIVGEFTDTVPGLDEDLYPQSDGSYLVRGSANVRDLNRRMQWNLPTDGPKTLNGLILEYLEAIPEPGTGLLIAGYPVEVVQIRGAAISMARVRPPVDQPADANTVQSAP